MIAVLAQFSPILPQYEEVKHKNFYICFYEHHVAILRAFINTNNSRWNIDRASWKKCRDTLEHTVTTLPPHPDLIGAARGSDADLASQTCKTPSAALATYFPTSHANVGNWLTPPQNKGWS